MRCMVIGKESMRVERRGVELSHAEALEMSAGAIVVSMEELPGGKRMLYRDGAMSQYDPVDNVVS